MTRSPEPLDVVGLIYDAALDPELWADVLEQVTDLLDGHFGVLVPPPGRAMVTVRQDPHLFGTYVEHFRQKDLLVRKVARLAPGSVVTDRMVVSRAEFEASEYYNDFLRPQRAEEGIAAVFSLATSGIQIWRSPAQGRWEDEQIRFLRELTPHFQRAMEIGRRLANADPRRAGAAGLLDNLPHAIFLVAGGGRVVFANSAAEALLADADAIRFVSGYLCAATKDHTARLSNAVARASGEGSGNAGDAVSLPRRAPGRALTAFVAPLAPAVDWGVLPSPSAIILVVDPGSHRQPSEGTIRLADHHRDGPPLARRELQCLLLVAAGKSSKAIAIELSLSPHTIDQYIESAMRKLDSATRAEAVAMAVALGLMAA